MKTRILILIALSAVITFSFTAVKDGNQHKTKVQSSTKAFNSAPVGGLVSDEK